MTFGGRRRFLTLTCAAAGLVAAPALLRAAGAERRIGFLNLHTRETVDAVYWADGAYVEKGLAAISRVLRDHRSDEVTKMDPRLIDILYELRSRVKSTAPYHVISGYRSPKSNAALLETVAGVAQNSFHMRGQATDVRLPGVELLDLRWAARDLEAGGVGFYPINEFIHVDTGPLRFW